MAITLFGSASTPADNAASATDPTVVTPPADMLAGDLVFMTAQSKTTTDGLAISESGGQTWTTTTEKSLASTRQRQFWCTFDGTWDANPSVNMQAGTICTVRMLVFRPAGGTSSTWAVDVAQVAETEAEPSDPFTVTITGITTQTDGALVIASWLSVDDTSWGSLTAGWTAITPAQIRNTQSVDLSMTHAWFIDTAKGATGNVSQNQTANPKSGCSFIMAFKEIAGAAGESNVLFMTFES